uniref:Uncharacterized protein n=1 Tax=Arundo donax TaxID=35708 RepID=A0A0A9CY25_ARUDO
MQQPKHMTITLASPDCSPRLASLHIVNTYGDRSISSRSKNGDYRPMVLT